MDDNAVFLELSESLPFLSANPDGPFSESPTVCPKLAMEHTHWGA
jgi:hypothetical protein